MNKNDPFRVAKKQTLDKLKCLREIATEKCVDQKPFICTHCKKAKVELIKGYVPWSDYYWQCPLCDSTYPIIED
jgi:hypothetical protein